MKRIGLVLGLFAAALVAQPVAADQSVAAINGGTPVKRVSTTFTVSGDYMYSVAMDASASQSCRFRVYLDGEKVSLPAIPAGKSLSYSFLRPLTTGSHSLRVRSGCASWSVEIVEWTGAV